MTSSPAEERYGSWQSRVIRGNLAFGVEFWDSHHDHPARGNVKIQDPSDESDATYVLTRPLLGNVLHAAKVVLTRAERIRQQLDDVQAWADENVPDDEPIPEYGYSIDLGHEFSVELAELVWWTRALADRVDRTEPSISRRLGLLPEMNPRHPATDRIRRAFDRFWQRVGRQDVRHLAGFTLHSEVIPRPHYPAAELSEDRQVIVHLPDPLHSSVWSADEFTYDEGRDLRGFSESVASAVDAFVDEILSAFEEWSGSRRWKDPQAQSDGTGGISAGADATRRNV